MGGATAGTTSAVIIGSFICIALIFVSIAGVIILSIIPVYSPARKPTQYGDEYRCDALTLKTLYTNVSATFVAGTIANSSELSELCSTQLSGKKNVAGCVLQDGEGWGPYNSSTNARRRRRATSTAGLYSVHQARVFFTTPCQKQGDKNKYENGTNLSNCVKDRLEIVNGLVNDNAANFIEWTPVTGFILAVLDTASSYIHITPTQVFGIPRARAASIIGSLPQTTSAQKDSASAGCRYIGVLPLTQIYAILAASTSTPSESDSSSVSH